jgi:hypothetical protein
MEVSLLQTLPLNWNGHKAEHLLVHPLEQRAVQLDQFLAWHVRQHRAPLAFNHQIPHRGNGGLAPALVGYLGVIGDEMKFAAPMVETALFDFMAAHEVLAGVKSLGDGRGARARDHHLPRRKCRADEI